MGTETLAARINDWQAHKTIGHASDLLGVAMVVGNRGTAVMDAVAFVLMDATDAPPLVRTLAKSLLPDSGKSDGIDASEHVVRAHIRTLRRWTRGEPRDAIAWVDLARAYSIVGHLSGAKRCMDIAVALAPDNRFVLRCAARFWLHAGDAEKGHRHLLKGVASSNDPWLIAAEIALSAAANGRTRLLSRARRLLDDPRYAPHDVSELAAEMGTRDIQANRKSRARKRFRQSLGDPTENSLAQIAWVAEQNRTAVKGDIAKLNRSDAFEARSQRFFGKGEWRQALGECRKWAKDEPFSSRPVIQGSYVAAVGLADYLECYRLAATGLKANPRDFALLNNKAFACAHLGKLQEARTALDRLAKRSMEKREKRVFLATSGLVAYRAGDILRGREHYREALDGFRAKVRDAGANAERESYGQAAINWVQEEQKATGQLDVAVLVKAIRVIGRSRGSVAQILRSRIEELLEIAGNRD